MPLGHPTSPPVSLRQWREEDLALFIAMNADHEVMRYFHVLYRRSRPREFKRLLECGEFS